MMKKLAVAALSALLCLGLSAGMAFASEPVLTEIDPSIPVEPGSRIAVVSKKTKGQFWSLVKHGMQDAVSDVNEAYGFEKSEQITMSFEGPDDEKKVEEQINTIDAVLAENPDVLCLSVGDRESCLAQIEAATENGIPVVIFDSNVNDAQLVSAFRSTDHIRTGELAAEALAQAMGETGRVVVFSVQEKTDSAQARIFGFEKTMENYPDIEIIDVIGEDEVEDMKAAMTELLETDSGLTGVFCSDSEMAELYLSLSADLRGDIPLVGVDATTKQQQAIKNGEELCVISQDPRAIGYETMLTAILATAEENAEDIPEVLLFEPKVIDLTNIDDPEYAEYVYTD